MIRIKHEGLDVPMSPMFTLYIADLLAPHENEKAVTINFRDPDYSADRGGYHPVEIRLENEGDEWRFSYITDFCHVGSGYMAELAKELDWDFDAGVFNSLFGTYPIEQTIEMFQVWESNFVYYAMVSKVFTIQKRAD
ncbi:DUF2787 family protein [Colwellia echini]|uniref:DUF2787 domain-containing protein n=1 Tax=Colwellia echini TaxID=1982103 RepID=A0ABY3MXS5_9GAMM|nr:DUF2787 family protein [Colwellia echini]TYK66010.1 DUF2787 domain-containing protein [Colwellia echini]